VFLLLHFRRCGHAKIILTQNIGIIIVIFFIDIATWSVERTHTHTLTHLNKHCPIITFIHFNNDEGPRALNVNQTFISISTCPLKISLNMNINVSIFYHKMHQRSKIKENHENQDETDQHHTLNFKKRGRSGSDGHEALWLGCFAMTRLFCDDSAVFCSCSGFNPPGLNTVSQCVSALQGRCLQCLQPTGGNNNNVLVPSQKQPPPPPLGGSRRDTEASVRRHRGPLWLGHTEALCGPAWGHVCPLPPPALNIATTMGLGGGRGGGWPQMISAFSSWTTLTDDGTRRGRVWLKCHVLIHLDPGGWGGGALG